MNLRYFRLWASTWRIAKHIAIEMLTPLPSRIPLPNMRPVHAYERATRTITNDAFVLLDSAVSREVFDSSTPINN